MSERSLARSAVLYPATLGSPTAQSKYVNEDIQGRTGQPCKLDPRDLSSSVICTRTKLPQVPTTLGQGSTSALSTSNIMAALNGSTERCLAYILYPSYRHYFWMYWVKGTGILNSHGIHAILWRRAFQAFSSQKRYRTISINSVVLVFFDPGFNLFSMYCTISTDRSPFLEKKSTEMADRFSFDFFGCDVWRERAVEIVQYPSEIFQNSKMKWYRLKMKSLKNNCL